jgi:hypothetical protein
MPPGYVIPSLTVATVKCFTSLKSGEIGIAFGSENGEHGTNGTDPAVVPVLAGLIVVLALGLGLLGLAMCRQSRRAGDAYNADVNMAALSMRSSDATTKVAPAPPVTAPAPHRPSAATPSLVREWFEPPAANASSASGTSAGVRAGAVACDGDSSITTVHIDRVHMHVSAC